MNRALAALAAAVALSTGEATAATLVDTGADLPFTYGRLVSAGVWLAARFEVAGPTVLTDVESYFTHYDPFPTTLTLVLREDDGGPGDEIYAAPLTVSPPDGWDGLHGLSWQVRGGAYWLAFEVRPGQDYAGELAPALFPTPVVFSFPPTIPYTPAGDFGLALRIQGDAVPEPATWALMILGFGATGLALRRRRAARNPA